MILWGLLIWLLVSSVARGLLLQSVRPLSYTEFKEHVRQGRVTEITIKGDEISGTAKPKKQSAATGEGEDAAAGKHGSDPYPFSTTIPSIRDPELLPLLDATLVRPGRFDRRIVLELPQKEARKKIIEIHTRDIPLAHEYRLTIRIPSFLSHAHWLERRFR